MSGESSTFSKGDRLDRFEIRELIGQGGMGAIYRALDTRLGRNVALKVVRPDRLGGGSGEQARQRFLREALAISKVDHRNVVRVLDFGYAGDTPYMAMEYLRGQDLGQLVKATAGFLPVAQVIDVMLAVCAAIRACHEVGIIHRDLKPSNIFLAETDGERIVKILDFGVSKPTMASDLTREGQIIGTPQYLAPEQIDGKALPETDQYAIGVMLYLCLTKELPYKDHASLGLFRAILLGKFPAPSVLRAELPQKLEATIVRAMSTAPEDRFESVYALGRELWPFASAEAREQWRSYFHDDRLRPEPKASAHAMPLIEALARGFAEPVRGPIADALALASTAAAGPAAVERPASPAAGIDGSDRPTTTSVPQIAGDAQKRPTVAIAIAAVALLAGGAIWFTSQRRPAGPKAPEMVSAPSPVPPPPPPAMPALPAHQAAPPPPSPALHTYKDESPAAPPPLPTPDAPRHRPGDPISPAVHPETHHRSNRRHPAAEHPDDVAAKPADGVPIMP